MGDQDVDEEEAELQAALMARRAQLAELKAAERQVLRSSSLPSAAAAADGVQPPRFVSKAERQQQEPVVQVPPPASAPLVKKPVKPAVKPPLPASSSARASAPPSAPPSHAQRHGKRFKFDWDESDDTSSHYAFYDPSSSSSSSRSNHHHHHGNDHNHNDDDAALRRLDARSQQHASSSSASAAMDVMRKPAGEMTARDWRIVRENFAIHTSRNTSSSASPDAIIPHPARSWDEMQLPPSVRQRIAYKHPTPIQMQSIPICSTSSSSSFDLIGQAETGSGKTAAFVIPFLVRLERALAPQRAMCHENGPLGLVLAPTRELVHQIDEQAQLLSVGLRSCAVVGGNSAEDQGFLLRQGVDLVVATPGRLLDLLGSRVCVLNHCSYVVLDEADRMIDMGFEAQVNKVLDALVVPRARRTTLMFSATMDPSVIRLAQQYMKPGGAVVTVRIGDEDGGSGGKNTNIDQHVLAFASEASKDQALAGMLNNTNTNSNGGPIIVFCNSKLTCDQLARQLKQRGTHKQCGVLHSGLSQAERELNLKRFKDGQFQVLIATDVAGRGLDVDGVAHVINYDCPSTLQRYTHRIGRTGRAGKRGKATTLILRGGGGGGEDVAVLQQIQKYLEQTGQPVPRDLRDAIGDLHDAGNANIQD